ncbi:MAG TPA: trypco2 family protein [Candidatus Limnocylindrales bacterium]|nr:trypco2 family protein [Candidatus Limnocylindrales bacterium]
MDDGVELAEIVRQLRGELALAAWQGEHQELKFELGPIELEFHVVVEKSKAGGGKARVLVADVDGRRQQTSSITHRIKLTLQPRLRDEPDRSPHIAGRALDGEE